MILMGNREGRCGARVRIHSPPSPHLPRVVEENTTQELGDI